MRVGGVAYVRCHDRCDSESWLLLQRVIEFDSRRVDSVAQLRGRVVLHRFCSS